MAGPIIYKQYKSYADQPASMPSEYIPYILAFTTTIIELTKGSVKKESKSFLVLSVGGFLFSLAGGIAAIFCLGKASWWAIIIVSVLLGVSCLLNGNILFVTIQSWRRRREIRKQVPKSCKDYRECVETDSSAAFSKLFKETHPRSNLWSDLTNDTLGYGVLTEATLEQRLAEIHQATRLSNYDSCKLTKRKLQSLALAAHYSKIKDSGEIIGDYLKSMKIVLDGDEAIKRCKVDSVPSGWRITYPAISEAGDSKNNPPEYHLRHIDYTTFLPICPTFEFEMCFCDLCSTWWSRKEKRWHNEETLLPCPVCEIPKMSREDVGVIGDEYTIDISSSENDQSINSASPSTTNSHHIVDIPPPDDTRSFADPV